MKKILFLVFLLSFTTAYSQTAQEIVTKAENSVKGKSSRGKFKMHIVNPDFERTLVMDSWWEGNDKALIIIESPKKEKGNKTLKIGRDMWTYLAKSETTLKLAPSMMLQSWNGSDLTNDDLVRESSMIEDYYSKLIKEEKIAGEDCWKIELTPKPDAPVVWGKIYYWVRKKDFLPSLLQFYDEDGVKIRTIKYMDYKNMNGRFIPTNMKVISNTKENSYTEFIYIDVEFDIDIPDRIFSKRKLKD